MQAAPPIQNGTQRLNKIVVLQLPLKNPDSLSIKNDNLFFTYFLVNASLKKETSIEAAVIEFNHPLFSNRTFL